MVMGDGEAGTSGKTLDKPNPDGEIGKGSPDSPNFAGSGETRIGNGKGKGSRDSDDISAITLAELRKRCSQQFNGGVNEASGSGNGSQIDAVKADSSSSAAASLRRSYRNGLVDESKKLKADEHGEEESDEKEQVDVDDDEEEEESEFSVGDFVWGKVKSHPWWPGRVFDPSEASERALKYKHEGRILVAYFGDATFAWCDSSQLKPFVENFAEMSRQSSSKSFTNAVEEAACEFARLVELDMTCYCTPKNDHNSNHEFSVNAGIKGGVNVNKGGLGKYSIDHFDPATFLRDLRDVGKHVSAADRLKLSTLKSQVYSVYRPKDPSLVLKCSELQKDAEKDGDGTGIEDPVPIMPDGLVASKRKERSVAEILYGNDKADEDGGERSGKKRRKVVDEGNKTIDGETPKSTTDHGDNAEEENKTGRKSSRMKVKEIPKPVAVVNTAAAMEESEMTPRTRERKRSRYLSPPYTNIEYFRQTAVSSSRGVESRVVESSNVSQKQETRKNSAPLVSCSVEASARKVLNDRSPEVPRSSSGRVAGEPAKDIASSDNVLSEIRSAAVSGKASKGGTSVKGFLTSYRSSKYQNGNISEVSEAVDQSLKNGKSKKREKPNMESKSEENPKTESEKAKSESKVKKVDLITDGEVTAENASAALHLKFPADYPLPSEDDLSAVYGKFGALDKSKMKISEENSSAKVVFVRLSDAEAAMKSSKACSPFGEAVVRYRIRHLKAISEDKDAIESDAAKNGSDSHEKRTRSSEKHSGGGLKLVKQKLEGVATMVAEAGNGKMSKELKLRIEGGLKDLLREVKALPASPSTSV